MEPGCALEVCRLVGKRLIRLICTFWTQQKSIQVDTSNISVGTIRTLWGLHILVLETSWILCLGGWAQVELPSIFTIFLLVKAVIRLLLDFSLAWASLNLYGFPRGVGSYRAYTGRLQVILSCLWTTPDKWVSRLWHKVWGLLLWNQILGLNRRLILKGNRLLSLCVHNQINRRSMILTFILI